MQSEYVDNLMNNAAWSGKHYGTEAITKNFMNMGFDNPIKALQSAQINFQLPTNPSTGFTFTNKDPNLGNPMDYKFNPETNMMEINKTYLKTEKVPEMGFNKISGKMEQRKNPQGQPMFINKPGAPYVVQQSMPLDQFNQLTNQIGRYNGWHNLISPAAIAKMHQEAVLLEKLKKLVGANPDQIQYQRAEPNVQLPVINEEV
jgi:hypothetical protein